jgi:selenocysteine lyase/cysteine desulfurase
MTLSTASPWDAFRRRMPVVKRYAYFDHASIAPLPAPVLQAVCDWALECAQSGNLHWSQWSQRLEQLRAGVARLLGAQPDEIALTGSTTQGIGFVAEGFPWQAGDNVVVLAQEFPSNQYPWLHLASRGVEPRRVPTHEERLELDRLAEACDAHTRIIALSWVGYATGWRNDLDRLAEFAHQRGALLFVDAIQGLGVLPIDVARTPVDFLVAGGQKWLLGPEGTGLLYIRRRHLDALRPMNVGWNSVRHPGDFTRIDLEFKPGASRYEGGAMNMGGLLGLAASLELLAEHGCQQLAERIVAVTDAICEQLARAGARIVSARQAERKSGIIAFDWPGVDPLAAKRHCAARQVVLNARAGRIRLSPHVYTSQDDIDHLLDALRALQR